ncbi:MAG: YwiC-like family protein [Opitutaceae bacterium]|nr:YwiC-like family protein [Opitutaceae bacterium]
MPARHSIRLTDLLLPRDHGSWSIALEPVALGLIAAPSAAGAALAVAVLALFLARRPLRLWRDNSAEPARRRAAAWLALVLTGAATTGGVLAGWRGGFMALWPLLLALPAAVAFVYFDLKGEARAATAELAGATAFALLPMAFGSLAKLPLATATGLAAAMLLRLVPTVLVIRAYLRSRKGQPALRGPAIVASLTGTTLAAALAASGIAPGATLGIALMLLIRALWLLGPLAPQLRAPAVGALESALGAGAVLALAFP